MDLSRFTAVPPEEIIRKLNACEHKWAPYKLPTGKKIKVCKTCGCGRIPNAPTEPT